MEWMYGVPGTAAVLDTPLLHPAFQAQRNHRVQGPGQAHESGIRPQVTRPGIGPLRGLAGLGLTHEQGAIGEGLTEAFHPGPHGHQSLHVDRLLLNQLTSRRKQDVSDAGTVHDQDRIAWQAVHPRGVVELTGAAPAPTTTE